MKISEEINISENGFLFNPNTGDSFNLNPTALKLVSLIKKGFDIDQVKNAFMLEYEVDDLTFEKDFYEFLSLLKFHGLTITQSNTEFN